MDAVQLWARRPPFVKAAIAALLAGEAPLARRVRRWTESGEFVTPSDLAALIESSRCGRVIFTEAGTCVLHCPTES